MYDINLLLCIQYQTPDDGQETCPKHAEFYSKNRFEKLVHLIGFIVVIQHCAVSKLNSSRPIFVGIILCLYSDVSGRSSRPDRFTPGKSSILLEWMLGGPQNHSVSVGERRNLCSCQVSNPVSLCP